MADDDNERLSDVQLQLKSMGFSKRKYNLCSRFFDFDVALEWLLQNEDNEEDEKEEQKEQKNNEENKENEQKNEINQQKVDEEKEKKEEPENQQKNDVKPPEESIKQSSEMKEEAASQPTQTTEKKEEESKAKIDNFRDHASDQQRNNNKYSRPAGLKRTDVSYLNPLIQSLFFIPRFRNAIVLLPYAEVLSHFDYLHVLRELQKLFALLYGSDQLNVESDSFLNELIHIGNSLSHQSQLDPLDFCHSFYSKLKTSIGNNVKNINQNASRNKNNSDEKVLEELFESLSLDPQKNIIEQFFEIEVLNILQTEDNLFGNDKLNVPRFFSQLELNPSSLDLSSALWDYTNERIVQQISHGRMVDAKSSSSFARIPPFLHFQIKRFSFSNMVRNDYKFDHSPFSFPKSIYLDPFLKENREITDMRRSQIKILREKITQVKEELSKLIYFNQKPLSLHLILESTQKFLLDQMEKSNDNWERSELGDVTMELSKKIEEINQQINEHQSQIDTLQKEIDSQFEDMKHHLYTLHAILVHEGKYDSGSSWSYIYFPVEGKWYRFYDSLVEQVADEQKMFEETFGTNNAHLDQFNQKSTYSLIYIDHRAAVDILDFNVVLPQKLKFLVDQTNEKYRREVEEAELNKRYANEPLIDQFLRIFTHKENEFKQLFHTEKSTKVQIKSFKHFLESINRHNFVQFKLANRIHKNLFGFPLYDHDDFKNILRSKDQRNLADFDFRDMMRMNDFKSLYQQSRVILSYVNESMNLWINCQYLSSAMHLFSGIKADLDLSTPLASRTPELVSYIEVVLESLCEEAKVMLERKEKADSLERYTIATIICSKLKDYPHIVNKVKTYWLDGSPSTFREVNPGYYEQITNFFSYNKSMSLGLKKQDVSPEKPKLTWEKHCNYRARIEVILQRSL